jgi:SAM-dependent methyltransferase
VVVEESGSINAYYGRQGLGQLILDALRAAGKDPDHLAPDDLALVDQLHSRGKEGTLELANFAGLRGDERVLDVGGGFGGPARILAHEVGCKVTVLDLTEEFCLVGAMLTKRTGLADRVAFRHGDALNMPFADETFEVVWTQHSTMNIADKERLYSEIRRVLRPGGRLAMHEVLAGPIQPISFPAPWAPDPSMSFVRSPDEVRSLITDTGFVEVAWADVTELSLGWFRERAAAMAAAGPGAPPPPLGLHVTLGPSFGAAFRNFTRDLGENRAVVVQAVFERS